MKHLTEEEYKLIYGVNGEELDKLAREFAESDCTCTTLIEHINNCKKDK